MIVDFVHHWSLRTELPAVRLLSWIGLSSSKWHAWKDRYGKANEHNAWIPRDHWLDAQEKQAILDFQELFPLTRLSPQPQRVKAQKAFCCQNGVAEAPFWWSRTP